MRYNLECHVNFEDNLIRTEVIEFRKRQKLIEILNKHNTWSNKIVIY